MTAGLELYRNMLVTTMATPESWVRVRVRVRGSGEGEGEG